MTRAPGYVASEYLGGSHAPGDVVGGTRHEDLMDLSFPDATLDLVVTSDVLEHVPDPYRAHREIFRVLRPGGRHVFTVPSGTTALLDRSRAALDDGGALKLFEEPVYHGDPLRQGGALVFTDFGLEMIVRLAEIGFDVRAYRLHSVWRGILGSDGIVFDAVRPGAEPGP
jgi:SAM-dependent methyltransferase